MRRTRLGITLVELMVAIAIMSVVMALATTTLAAVFRIERQTSADIAQGLALSRLASRWRTDVHEAISATAGGDCALKMADGRTIEYRFSAPQIVREIRRADEVIHRDAFTIVKRASAAFSVSPQGAGQLATLSIKPANESKQTYAAPAHAASMEAVVNLQGRTVSQEAAP